MGVATDGMQGLTGTSYQLSAVRFRGAMLISEFVVVMMALRKRRKRDRS